MRLLVIYLIGVVFGLGISIGGMANPMKVVNFFDVTGPLWDPSLGFVMGAALVVTAIGYRLVFKKPHPIFEPRFQVPTSQVIDTKLIGGAALFGIGWGISGFCPGASIPAVGTGDVQVLVFIASLIAGMYIARSLMRVSAKRRAAAAS